MKMEELGIFQDLPRDPRPAETPTWNLWHGCTKVSAGCAHCYMYRRDESVGRDPSKVEKTREFDLPVRVLRSGPYRGMYAVPAGSLVYTCFSSDFFHPAADEWRQDAWDMIRTRSDCGFFMITKRPERIAACLPPDWGEGWDHVTVAVTCENADAAAAWLDAHGWTYTRTDGVLEFGQPHRSMEDAVESTAAFHREWDRTTLEARVRESVQETGREDFPLYTPKTRSFGLFVIPRAGNEQHLK